MTEFHSHYALPVGTMVQEYRIIEILGSGSFGIVYKAENKYFSEVVALKEFLPIDLAGRSEGDSRVRPLSSESEKAYHWARSKFLQEAKTLRELGSSERHPNIVHVRQFIEANDTAYMVMDFEEGKPLSKLLKDRSTLMEKEINCILHGLLDELGRVHEASVLHRDIKPSNILIRSDGSPVLIDFGAARKDIAGSDRSTMAMFSPAYAAVEQLCPIGAQGPWTDIYGLGATLYRAVTGGTAPTAADRLQGQAYVSAADVAKSKYSSSLLAAIDAALELYPEVRPQSIFEWKMMLMPKAAVRKNATVLRPPFDSAAAKPGKSSNLPSKVGSVPMLITMIVLVAAIATGWGLYWLNNPSAIDREDNTMDAKADSAGAVDKMDKRVKKAKTKTFPIDSVDESNAKREASLAQTQLKVHSEPTRAHVFVDGKDQGITPIHTHIGNGMHSLRLSLKGYYDWESNLLVEDKVEIPIRIPLLKK
jgi:serine/threonine protein kinase